MQTMKARWRQRRIIYNNDGDDVIEARSGVEHEHDVAGAMTVRATGDMLQDFLDARSTPLIGTQVDSNWFASCMAGLTFSHHTKLGGFYGKGIPLELVRNTGATVCRYSWISARAWPGSSLVPAHERSP